MSQRFRKKLKQIIHIYIYVSDVNNINLSEILD